jgi:glycosyltransferase involved in cell wall biosynthesis
MRIAVFCDVFPELSETFVVSEIRALLRAGHEVRVVALGVAEHPHWPEDLDVPVTFMSALRWPRRLRLAALLKRWRAEHVHVHFAARAAQEGLRIGKAMGAPVSVTAHAYDIFKTPVDLAEKIRRAAFVTTGCRYNLEHLRTLVEPEHGARIHELLMGVDTGVFRRTRPHPDNRHVVAVGRLVEKKGFDVLLEACAAAPSLERLTIAGDGPLADSLRARAAELGVAGRVHFAGARTPAQVRDLLEDAAVLAMPCVVAADGDRDSMPVAVKEAMAMEVPVVASDEVGLPELLDAKCGRLVAPRDPAALAAALEELLLLPVAERAAMGRHGRARVLERCDVDRETARLVGLMQAAPRR